MTTKSDDKNDWEVDDDNEWDVWDDAEDNTPEDVQPSSENSRSSATIQKDYSNVSTTVKSMETNVKTENNITKEIFQTESKIENKETSGWGSLFGGVVSSVLSTATGLTTTVSHGLDKVIGVPDPAELARINALEEAQCQENLQRNQQFNNDDERSLKPSNSVPAFGFDLVNNVTSLGSKVLNTGLDTLEEIGKKTMNILQENDPLIKNKIKKLGLEQEKPNLSQILKEAKHENDQIEQSLKELNLEKSKAQLRFEVLFENNCGLVHLEALEILSKESELKIRALKDSVSGKALDDLMETIHEVKELMELEDLEHEADNENYSKEELDDFFKEAIQDIDLQIQFEEIINLWSKCTAWLADEETKSLDVDAVFAKGITSLAQTCAYEMLKLHKIAELLLVKSQHSTANEVDGIVQLCKQFNMHLQTVANHFAAFLSKHPEQNEAKSRINTLFAEMVQARQQIEKAFSLFLPILQIGAV